MKPKRLLRITLWVATYILLRTFGGMLAFCPGQGTVLEKQFNQEWDVRLDEVELWVNGTEWSHMLPPNRSVRSVFTQEILTRDTYGSTKDGSPLELQREFVRIGQELEVFIENTRKWAGSFGTWSHMIGSCELEDETVLFTREQDRYEPTFLTVEKNAGYRRPDDELLTGLTEDMDLRVLLPSGSVSVGDTWEVSPIFFIDILSPGGYFPWEVKSGGAPGLDRGFFNPVQMGAIRSTVAELLEGHVDVTYAAEEDGQARLELDIQIQTHKDMKQLTQLVERITDWFDPTGRLEIGHLELTFTLEADGIAHWDTRRAHLRDLQLDGKFETRMALKLWSGDFGSPQQFPIEFKTATSGVMKQQIEFH